MDYNNLITTIAGHINNTNTNIANLASTLMTNLFNRRSVRENNQLQRDLANQANQWQIEQRDYENWYNSPAGLQSRGLNPALAMANGGAALAGSVSAGEAHMADTDPFRANTPQFQSPAADIVAMAQARDLNASANKKEAEIPFIQEQKNLVIAQAGETVNRCNLLGIELEVEGSIYLQKINTIVNELAARDALARYSDAEAKEKKKYVIDNVRNLYESLKATTEYKQAQRDIAKKESQMLNTQMDLLEKELERATKDMDWYTADKIFGYVTGLVSAASGAVMATSAFRTSRAIRGANALKRSAKGQVDLDDYDIGLGVLE